MKKLTILSALFLLPIVTWAQQKQFNVTTYVNPYFGVNLSSKSNTTQTGTAHKRGNYNAFNTDFDLLVNVSGESESSIGTTYGINYGTTWNKTGSKLNSGFEIDVFQTSNKHESELSNTNDEQIGNVVGANLDSVSEFVKEHYGAGHHEFANSMTIKSTNFIGSYRFSYNFNPKFAIHSSIGLGISSIQLKDAISLQMHPAAADPGYETTKDNGGGAVNHFNSNNTAYCNTTLGKFKICSQLKLTSKLNWTVDLSATYRGNGDFTFGSTKYTDHAPTDNWNYSIEGGINSFIISTGISISL